MSNLGKSFAAIVIAGLFIATAVHAAPEETAGSAQQEAPAIVDVGNKICPLTGENVDGKSFYVYKGRRYGVCCPECAVSFAEDPETYAMIADKAVSRK